MPKLTRGKTLQPQIRGLKLARNEVKFKFALTGSLENKYDFKKLSAKTKEFHDFIDDILVKQMTISEVEHLYLRTKGKPTEKCHFNGKLRRIVHLGKDRTPLRIFGYYNDENYFVISKIDPNHNTHK